MHTYEMVAIADDNGRVYECEYGTYSRDDGFRFNENINPIIQHEGWRDLVNILFHENLWRLKKEPVKRMTLQEIERELGYRVRIVDTEPEKEVSDERREEVDKTIEMFRKLFGIDIDPEEYY